ncbi:MAG: hypothetical protein A3G34_13045 [Candidatus Lindowbacteria bacterium RIFCSPLOWO2_12_FULL_62_27]|nr:MAG: hypothetical protein A3I06_15005 [Candidatus Lindowbacteria bacterium RIFCSPLOWO2_02_FULL_62_12]OGH62511.1 MAG: hypothetical protein A3G34_13045 [Candidatus Lindowbacteria bacterium RIFCSPLOWO2_12_FULL_62_27]
MQPVALVTGAARRVGRSVAEHLAAAGYAVAVHYRTSARDAGRLVAALRAGGGAADKFRADLSKVASIPALVLRIERTMGPIQLLVNSASLFTAIPFARVTERQWDREMSANLKSVFFLSREVGRRMQKRRGGVIVNIEDAAVVRPYRGHAPYLVSKAGVAMLTRVLALELAPAVRVCGVSPGPVLLPDRYRRAERERAVRRTLLKREGTPEDVARAVVFLAKGARYTTGTTLFVDGGRTAL